MNWLNGQTRGAHLRDNINFCSPCVIILTTCNAGNRKTCASNYSKQVAKGSGCHVIAAGGFVRGSLLKGGLNVTRPWRNMKTGAIIRRDYWDYVENRKEETWSQEEQDEIMADTFNSQSDRWYGFSP